jgi:hypothetical protein
MYANHSQLNFETTLGDTITPTFTDEVNEAQRG